jgi:hypothetical protein
MTIPCDDAADCATAGLPGTVCCAALKAGGKIYKPECLTFSACAAVSGLGQLVLCDLAVPGSCSTGGTCKPITAYAELTQYHACQ